ncbi:MAG: hypothetical protein Q8P01_03390, partial [bacterium]|nr:hypothetical protein [bacterium]
AFLTFFYCCVAVACYARTGLADRARHPLENFSMSPRSTIWPGLGTWSPSYSDSVKVTVVSAGNTDSDDEFDVILLTTYRFRPCPYTDITTASSCEVF